MNKDQNPLTARHPDNLPSAAGRANLIAKINRFSELEASWIEGKGLPFNQKDLDWFTNALVNNFPNSLPEPTITPTADGEVRLEWNQGNQVIILETEVQPPQAYYIWFNRPTQADHETCLELDQSTHWKCLISQKNLPDRQVHAELIEYALHHKSAHLCPPQLPA